MLFDHNNNIGYIVGFNLYVIVCFFVVYGIYIQAYPSLSYDSVNAYTLTVACTDSKDTATGSFHVYITRNNAPVFTNLQGILHPNKGSNVTLSNYHALTILPHQYHFGSICLKVKTFKYIQNIRYN